MSTLILQAPAKLNLSLRILGKRPDGYHDIDTIMVKLPGLNDDIVLEPAAAFGFSCDDPSLPGDESNLVVKAARAYETATGEANHCHITLKKRIPHGAGLGGGSSDAAMTLLGLNRFHDSRLGAAQLHEIAASLGSDIPFFLVNGAARCQGRGEIVTAVPSPASLPVLLLKPGFAVATADAYRRWESSRALPNLTDSPQDVDGIECINDLERAVFGKHRFLAELKQWLLARTEVRAAFLCGSGSTMAAVLHPQIDATRLANCARHELDPALWHWSGTTGV